MKSVGVKLGCSEWERVIAGRDYMGASSYSVEIEVTPPGSAVFLWLGSSDGGEHPASAVAWVRKPIARKGEGWCGVGDPILPRSRCNVRDGSIKKRGCHSPPTAWSLSPKVQSLLRLRLDGK